MEIMDNMSSPNAREIQEERDYVWKCNASVAKACYNY